MIEIVESKSKWLSGVIYRIKSDPVEATLILIMLEAITNKIIYNRSMYRRMVLM